jgi:RDD family
MNSEYGGPWSSQSNEGAAPGPPGWIPPGPASASGPPPTGGSAPAYPGPYGPGQPAFGTPPGYPPGPAGYGPQASPVGYAVPLRTDYTSWGKRVVGWLIDHIPTYIGLIIFSVGYVMWIVAIAQSTGSPVDLTAGAVPMIVGTLVMLAGLVWTIYNRWIVGGRTGQSLGKRVTRTILLGEPTNAPIGPMNAFLRDMVHILDGFAYVGFLWPLWDEKRQTFADKIMRTIVINAG